MILLSQYLFIHPCSTLCKIHSTFLLPSLIFLPSLLCTKLWFGLFAPALLRSSFRGGGCVMTAVWTCWMQDCCPYHYTCNVCLAAKSTLWDVDFYVGMRCLQLDSSLLFSSIFSLNKNFVYTGNEGEFSGKCAFTELLRCGASEGDLYKTHTELCSLSQL